VWLITAVFALLLVSASVAYPIYRAPDEVNHVDMIWGIRHELRYPNFDARRFSADVWASRPVAGIDDPFHRTAGEAIPRDRRPRFGQLAPYAPTEHRNQVANHPFLYYALLAAPLFVAPIRDLPFDRVVAFLRFASLLLMIPLPVAIFVTARRLYGSVPVATAASAVPLAIPQLVHVGAAVNNDDLLTLLFALLTAVLVFVATGSHTYKAAVAVGVLGGLALLTKGFALVVPVWAIGAYALALARSQERARLVKQAIAAIAIMTVLGGWWWIRNAIVFGTVQPAIAFYPLRQGFVPDTAWWLHRFAHNMVTTFWSPVEGPGDPTLPYWMSMTATAILLIGVVLAFSLRNRTRALAWGDPLLLVMPTIGIAAIVAAGAYADYAKIGLTPGLQGRYLFPGVAGLSVTFAAGAGAVLRSRQRYLPALVLGAAAVIQTTIVVGILRTYWGPATPFSLGRSVGAMLAWSPWPSPAVIVVWIALVLACVALAAAVIRQARAVADEPAAA
jgi:4-amino-4-deoxy-L-arabinose transferase-like glycosyltransferase